MHTLEFPLVGELALVSSRQRAEVDRELRLLLAVKLFELGRVSLGQAAEIAGRGKVEFIDELGRLCVPLIDYDDLDAEFEFGA